MQVLTEIVRNIVLILLFTTFLQLLLPSQSMQPFIKVVLGLFVLFSFLNPFLQLVNRISEKDLLENVAFAENETGMPFRERTEQQIAAMLRLVTGLDNVEVKVVLEKSGTNSLRETIQEIVVILEHSVIKGERSAEMTRQAVPADGQMTGEGAAQQELVPLEESNEKSGEERRVSLVQAMQIQGTAEQDEPEITKRVLPEELVYTICRCFGVRENQVRVQFQ